MLQEPDYRENLSLMLSEVLDDIGVNEITVMRRRRKGRLSETMSNIMFRLNGHNITEYFLGSHGEGTTTIGIDSDSDYLSCLHDYNIIQNLSDWEHGKRNYLMIQDENTTPGYCFLQRLRSDVPLPVTVIPDEHHTCITDKRRRILYKNTVTNPNIPGAVYHGPSLFRQGQPGECDSDHVLAFFCKSWPKSASGWLDRQGMGNWPTQDMRRYAASTGCFVVPIGSKVSKYPELEWRISTTLAERYLMFDLNLTQIRCYVLLKMILKSFLNPGGIIDISSFMCKTVLLHCIESTKSSIWKENNLHTCLINCLLELHSCVQNDCCSHFIIQENNLMAGKLTAETKHELSKNISDFIQNGRLQLFRIDIDDLGLRLQVKLNMVPRDYYYLNSPEMYNLALLKSEFLYIASHISEVNRIVLAHLNDKSIRTMKQYLETLMAFCVNGNELQQAACKYLAPFLSTTYGSVLASSNIGQNNKVSPEALVWLLDGFNSDISSSRLKLASVFYRTGDMEKAEHILGHTEQEYYSYPVVPICRCWTTPIPAVTAEFTRICSEQSEDFIQHITAFCVRFIRKENNCVPYELQYEMFRSTQDDMIHRHKFDYWMNWAVVDSLPFLYFLQYKIYRYQQRRQDQQQALSKLKRTITGENLGHRETALNILGQCMEQENRPQQALSCYLLSLQLRSRNNIANFHICKLLSRVLNSQ